MLNQLSFHSTSVKYAMNKCYFSIKMCFLICCIVLLVSNLYCFVEGAVCIFIELLFPYNHVKI